VAKLHLITLESSKSEWVAEALGQWSKKINPILSFEHIKIKAPSLDRKQSDGKAELEGELILKKIEKDDWVVLLDERGRGLTSKAFSKELVQWVESGKKRVVFVIGGSYGVSEHVKSRANIKIKLSDFTLNHWVAQVVLTEQIYRALAIWRNLPYHND
jgi:23S rRNA (pseudouridine1915-N3)-methyltransferase